MSRCRWTVWVATTLGVIALALPSVAQAVDGRTAENLARRSGCLRCHAPEKKKEGPSLKELAARWKGKNDAMAKLTRHVTTNPKVKIDGSEQEHEAVRTTNPAEVKNLLEWILQR